MSSIALNNEPSSLSCSTNNSLDSVALANGCIPFSVILNRLSQETIDFYCKSNLEPPESPEGNDEGDDIDADKYEEKEPQIITIDLEKFDSSIVNNNNNNNNNTTTTTFGNLQSRIKLDDKIFCLFNLEEFDDQYEAVQAYYRELRYAPFRCIECDEATVELKGMVDHYLNQHPTIKKAQYWVEEIPAKEKWVHKFIKYQIACHNEEDEMFPNDTVNKFCPVCNHYDYLLRLSNPPKTSLKVTSMCDRNHINKHLKYNPWECILCRESGRRYAISSVNNKAQEHLIHKHKLPRSDDCLSYFKKTATIPELDNFLREYINIIQENERSNVKPVVRRKPLAGKPNRQIANHQNRGKQTGQLYKQASASFKKFKESRDSVRNVKKANNRKSIEYRDEDNEDYQPFKDDSSRFFCIFCTDDNLSDIYSAWGHYGLHLKYTPIICGICNKTFTSDTSFRYHGIEHVEHSDLPFTRNCDEAIETWGHEFLQGLTNGTEAKPEFAEYCPVCEKIFSKPVEPPHLSANSIKTHIYSHLKYHPYECLPCQLQCEKKTFVGDLDYQAALHLNSEHSITVTPAEIKNYYIKTRGIESLDTFLREHFAKIAYHIGGAPMELSSSTASTITPTTMLPNLLN
ncbi:uncharacterized protein LOC128393409 [Panonychus citri]|uniref:uncharacterized protein LOC128393409 n=1 Tax=Panonychus citri TaxID=50023 RepID=UPI0023075BCB|nr:uncharacterized protein LOC128393409 [Panonychus citri]